MAKKSPVAHALAFLVCIAIPIGIGFFVSSLTVQEIKTWYTTINKPSFNPQNWVFAPVWTVLYVLMGISSYRVWCNRKTANGFNWALAIYILQLVLNFIWSIIFFEGHQIQLSLVVIILLLLMIVVSGIIFYRFDKIAGWLFLPYFLWVSFATYLNYTIFTLN